MAFDWRVILVLACSVLQSWGASPEASNPQVVYPVRVDPQGHVISLDVTSKYHYSSSSRRSGRVKRDSFSEGEGHEEIPREKLYIVINNDNKELFLKLTPNTKLVTPYTVIEWVLEDGRRIFKQASGDCFYVGRLQDAEQSLVAISNCDGLTGYIQTQNDSYFIEPLKSSHRDRVNKAEPQPHLIYKVDSITSRLNLSLQQDQEFQEAGQSSPDESSNEQNDEDEEEEEDNEDDNITFLELDHLFRKRRSVSIDIAKAKKSGRLGSIKRLKQMRRKRNINNRQRQLRSRLRRSVEDNEPKFLRNGKQPKFTRTPKFSERKSRSTSMWPPKFFRSWNSPEENERQKRDDEDLVNMTGEEKTIIMDGSGSESDVGSGNDENEVATEDKKSSKKRNKKNRKNCRRNRKNRRRNNSELNNESTGEDENSESEACKPRKSRKKLTKEERERRKQEKRERKRRKKEQRRKERERKRLLREKKRQERRKRRGKTIDEEERRENDVNPDENLTNVTTEEKRLPDPFEGEDWDGYSPDLFWETEIAAGSSGLQEVSLGPSPNITDPPKWLELVVAVDKTVIDFHGDDEVEKYVFTLFNIVSAIYEDPSLESSMELVMLRIIFYKNQKQSQVREGLAQKSLAAVNKWAELLHRVSPQHLRHDLAVWLTKTDLGGPSGYAPVSGVCQPARSCTLNRDEGLTSAFIIAHEMGHVLGLTHDGDKGAGNSCQDEGFQGSVMAPLVAATFSRFHWSKCSKREYHTKAPNWTCMLNKPQWKNATRVSSSIQYQYSLDDQCRMEFGEGYGLCRSFGMTDPCTHLWCSNSSVPHLCKTKKGPPLEGTVCGEQKWCRNGFCESTTQVTEEEDGQSPVRHNPQDGDWGPWSDWGPCSRTCGTGVSFKTRECDNPPPAWGGRRCTGKREEWKLCGMEECPMPHLDFRAQQCFLLDRIAKLDPRRAALAWLPYEPKKRRKKCRISCYSHATNEVYIGREFVVDGTPCSYDTPDDICVQGKCISVGCDKVISSSKTRDQCGVCGGDGGTCTHHHEVYHGVPPADYTLVAVLPMGARNVVVREETATGNFLAITDNSSSFILNGERTQEPAKTFISEGAKFVYSSQDEKELLQARGPLLQPLTVMIHGSSAQQNVVVTASYYTPVQEEYFQWEVGPFTACSVTCGGGERHQTLICRDRRTDLQVFHDQCRHLPRPPLNSTRCNPFGCEAKWIAGAWEHCSATCGLHGVQERVVSCVRLPDAYFANWTEGIVDPIRCRDHPKPPMTQECRREPCLAHWEPIGWGECSVTCGVGEQEQLWECTGGGGGNEVTYDCGPRPKQVRACIKPSCPSTPCLRDASEFCQIPVLYKYCKVPKYNALCCHTCANVVH